MRVLLSAYACDPQRGSEHGVGWWWVREISRRHDVWLLTRAKNAPPVIDELQSLGQTNVRVVPVDLCPSLQFLARFKRTKGLYYFLWQIAALIKAKPLVLTQKMDLAHHVTFMSATRWCFVGWLGIKSVVGPVGGLQSWPSGARDLVERTCRECLRDLSVRFLSLNPFFLLGPARADIFILANRSNADRLPKWVRTKTILGIQVGCELRTTKPPRQIGSETRVNFLWSGRMEDHKGFSLLILAIGRLKQRNSPALERLHVTVTTSADRTTACASRISRAGLDEHFKVAGWLARGEYEDVWRKTDVFVFTSLRETTGMALIEAMSRGIPPIVFNNGGPAEIVASGCGIKLQCSDLETMVSDLADAIELLASDPELRDRLGRSASVHATHEFDWKKVGNDMEKIYADAKTSNAFPNRSGSCSFAR